MGEKGVNSAGQPPSVTCSTCGKPAAFQTLYASFPSSYANYACESGHETHMMPVTGEGKPLREPRQGARPTSCPHCGEECGSWEARESHINDKHPDAGKAEAERDRARQGADVGRWPEDPDYVPEHLADRCQECGAPYPGGATLIEGPWHESHCSLNTANVAGRQGAMANDWAHPQTRQYSPEPPEPPSQESGEETAEEVEQATAKARTERARQQNGAETVISRYDSDSDFAGPVHDRGVFEGTGEEDWRDIPPEEQAALRVDEPNPDADEFKCDRCGDIWDIEDSIKQGGELVCPDCAGKRGAIKQANDATCAECGAPLYGKVPGHHHNDPETGAVGVDNGSGGCSLCGEPMYVEVRVHHHSEEGRDVTSSVQGGAYPLRSTCSECGKPVVQRTGDGQLEHEDGSTDHQPYPMPPQGSLPGKGARTADADEDDEYEAARENLNLGDRDLRGVDRHAGEHPVVGLFARGCQR